MGNFKISHSFIFLLSQIGVLAITFSCSNDPDKVFPSKNWIRNSPQELGVDEKVLEKALDYLASQSNSDKNEEVLIIRNGEVIFEGDSISNSHNIYSCTKGFTSLVMGLLADEGKLNLDDKVYQVIPELRHFYPNITWKHFATMTSGYSAKGISRWEAENSDWSWTPFQPDTAHFPPGTQYEYWDEAQMMFGKGLTLVAGKSMKRYLDEKVMNEIEFGDWNWGTEQDSSTNIPINNGCTGIQINAEQLARIGYLFLNEGNWNGKQLIHRNFVKDALSVQVPESLPVFEGERKSARGSGSYGFNWWVNSENGMSKMPSAPAKTAYLSGLNHNMCFVIPEWDMVIVRMGDDKNPDLPKHEVWDRFFNILKAGIEQ